MENKNYLVKFIPIEMEDDMIKDEGIFNDVDLLVKLKSKYVLKYVTSWFEEDPITQNMGLYIQSEDYSGISLTELLNQRPLSA